MKENDVVLRLTTEEALTLQDVLRMLQERCRVEQRQIDLLTKYAFRLVNSQIDPIISQLEAELESQGVR